MTLFLWRTGKQYSPVQIRTLSVSSVSEWRSIAGRASWGPELHRLLVRTTSNRRQKGKTCKSVEFSSWNILTITKYSGVIRACD